MAAGLTSFPPSRCLQPVADSLHDPAELARVERSNDLFVGWEDFSDAPPAQTSGALGSSSESARPGEAADQGQGAEGAAPEQSPEGAVSELN